MSIRKLAMAAVLAASFGGLAASMAGPQLGVLAQTDEPPSFVERGVAYAQDDPRQVVHAFGFASADQPRPAVAIIHGGGLIWGRPEDEESLARQLHAQGYAIFLVGYRLYDQLSGANAWPAPLEDVRAAVRWIRAHAADYGADASRVCAVGFSAGAHLASLLGTTDDPSATSPDGASARVECVVSLAGDGDVLVPSEDRFWNELGEQILGGSRDEHPELWEAASPAHNVDDHTVPFLVVHGTNDLDVPVESARRLVAALDAAGRDVTYLELPTYHYGIRDAPETWVQMVAFLDEHLRSEG